MDLRRDTIMARVQKRLDDMFKQHEHVAFLTTLVTKTFQKL